MSSLLEQAIIDAAALKEAAIKNAETALLNKYSNDIREAVENLLEQDEEQTGAPEADFEPDIPLAAAPEEAMAEETIVLDFEDLKTMAETLAEKDQELIGDEVSHDAAAPEGSTRPPAPVSAEEDVTTTEVPVALEEKISAEDLEGLLEELIVDIVPQKEGWAGTPDSIMDYKEEQELARRAATKAQEQIKALQDANSALTNENVDLKGKNTKLLETLQTLKEHFDNVNLSNARLVYTNKTLANGSLNGQQKSKIVKALSEASSIEEAKVIFETLESAVGSVTGKARPQSLRETLERPSATLPRRAAKTVESPQMDRMQILAGIKKTPKENN
jgi:hypothetical protein